MSYSFWQPHLKSVPLVPTRQPIMEEKIMCRYIVFLGMFFLAVNGKAIAQEEARVLTTSGQTQTWKLAEPLHVRAVFNGWRLETEDWSFPVVERKEGRWQLTFSNGYQLSADRLLGTISVMGDFGKEERAWSGVARLEITKSLFPSGKVGSFNRDIYLPIQVEFKSGHKEVFLVDSDEHIDLQSHGVSLRAPLLGQDMKIDWPTKQVRVASLTAFSNVTIVPGKRTKSDDENLLYHWPGISPNEYDQRNGGLFVQHDFGFAEFDLSQVVSIHPLRSTIRRALPPLDFQAAMADGVSFSFTGPNAVRATLDGTAIGQLNWQQVSNIKVEGVDRCHVVFNNSKEGTLHVEEISGQLDAGISFVVPVKLLSGISRLGKQASIVTDNTWGSITLTDGSSTLAKIEQILINGWSFKFVQGDSQRELFGIQTEWGYWLAAESYIYLADSGKRAVTPFGTFEVIKQPDWYVSFTSPTSKREVKSADIAAMTPPAKVLAGWNQKFPLRASITTTKGVIIRFTFQRCVHVSQPDSYWVGTRYNPKFDLSNYRLEPYLRIRSGDGLRTDASLSLLRKLTVIGGSTPEYRVKLLSKAGTSMEGTLVPPDIAPKGQGVSKWKDEENGLWFQMFDGSAFVFIKMSDLREVSFEG